LSRHGQESPQDAELGAYLIHRGSLVDHDNLAEALVAKGIDPVELHVLDETYVTLRQARRRLRRHDQGFGAGETRPAAS
jgi:hypothetical protein